MKNAADVQKNELKDMTEDIHETKKLELKLLRQPHKEKLIEESEAHQMR